MEFAGFYVFSKSMMLTNQDSQNLGLIAPSSSTFKFRKAFGLYSFPVPSSLVFGIHLSMVGSLDWEKKPKEKKPCFWDFMRKTQPLRSRESCAEERTSTTSRVKCRRIEKKLGT